MDNSMLEVILRVLRDYPNALENMQRANAILLDLAPALQRERILVRSFVEVDGFNALKNADAFPLAEKKLVQNLVDNFCMERTAAQWVVRLFGVATGHLETAEFLAESEGAVAKAERIVASSLHGQVAIGKMHVAAVAVDGTVFADGDNSNFQCDVFGWTDIVAVAAGDAHTLGLRSDGVVLATGSNSHDECDVGHLTGVKAICAFGYDSICVLDNGTVVAIGRSRFDLSTFTDIISVARYPDGLVGIKSDGTLSLLVKIQDDEAAEEIKWLLSCHDVEQVIANRISGCVIRGKDRRIYKSNQPANYFTQWREVVSIVDLADCFAILRSDGTVRVLTYDRDKPRPDTTADKWSNIVSIYGGYRRLIGLTKDGSLLVAYTHQGWLWSNKAMEMDYVSGWYPVGACE